MAGVPMTIAVAEFKGPDVHGVVRFAQSTGERASCSIEAVIDGLAPGAHGWSVHEFGDLTQGPMTTGPVYNIDPASSPSVRYSSSQIHSRLKHHLTLISIVIFADKY